MSACFEAGNLMAALDRPFDEVIAAWERATQIVPTRAEALHGASRYCRRQGQERRRHGICPPGHRSRRSPTGFSFSPGSMTMAFSTSLPSMPIGQEPIASCSTPR